jgi:hypothetical protein
MAADTPQDSEGASTMKTSSTRLLLMAFFVALGLSVAAQAQAQTVVKCDVPFEFSLGGHSFPSGAYSFTINDDGAGRLVVVRNSDGTDARILQTIVEGESRSIDTVARFNHYGRHYLLSGLSIAGDDIELKFIPTRAERELMVRNKGEIVTVMASR